MPFFELPRTGGELPPSAPQAPGEAPEAAPAGMGYFSLSIDANAARTILPTAPEFKTYKLNFVPNESVGTNGNTEFSVYIEPDDLSKPVLVLLRAGRWDLIVTAYTDEGDETAHPEVNVASGSFPNDLLDPGTGFLIGTDGVNSGTVTLRPLATGNGTFRWTVIYPAGSDAFPAGVAMSSASMTITSYASGEPITPPPVLSIAGASASGVTTLASGYYRVDITLESDDGKKAALTRILHILPNMESVYTHPFTASNFSGTLAGTVSIDGTASVGQTLTANTTLLGGRDDETIYYQWKKNGANITGEINSEYIVRPQDEYEAEITVEVYRAGYNGSRTSNPVTVSGVWVSSITAVYQQAGAVIYTATPLENLKAGLTVTAHNNDGTTNYEVTDPSEYELAGPLALDSSVVTVSYNGLTTTFNNITVTPVLTIGGTSYATLADAITATPEGEPTTITLEADIALPAGIAVNARQDITITAGSSDVTITRAGGMFTVNGGSLTLGGGSGGTLTLQGNGTLDGTGISIESGTLIMEDNVVITNFYRDGQGTVSSGGGVRVYNADAVFIMKGGVIEGNESTSGGGVYVYQGEFIMHGGEIKGNKSSGSGGGVNVNSAGRFTFNGGTIYGTNASPPEYANTATGNTAAISVGGISRYGDGSNIATTNDTITGRRSIDISAIPGVTAPAAGASPVTVITETEQYTGTVTWTADGADHSGAFAAGTVYTARIVLTAKTGFSTSGVAADFYTVAGADSVTNTANSGVVTAVFPSTQIALTEEQKNEADFGPGVTPEVHEATASNLQYVFSNLTPGEYHVVNITGTLNWDNYIIVESGVTVSLRGNGGKIIFDGIAGQVVVWPDAKLILRDITLEGRDNNSDGALVSVKGSFVMEEGAVITGNTNDGNPWAQQPGGGVYVDEYADFTMNGGSITGNTDESEWPSSGGVYVSYGATFVLNDGSIDGNTSLGDAGGVYIIEASFTMNGGSISGNTSELGGGGVVIDGGTFTMTDGIISGNTAYNDAGGVSVFNLGTFTMTGGAITGNTALGIGAWSGGGGVVMASGTTFNKSGDSVITGYTTDPDNGNRAEEDGVVMTGLGHAVWWHDYIWDDDLGYSIGPFFRDSTADSGVNMSTDDPVAGWEN